MDNLTLSPKEQKELNKWLKEKKKSKPASYLIYMFLIVTVVYISDEICTQIGTQMESILAGELFANPDSLSFLPQIIIDLIGSPDKATGRLSLINGIAATIFSALAVLYRPLSDKYGRKIFLIINTFGMGFAMIIIGLSLNVPVYFLGTCLISFFTPHDMQATYIYESSPKDKKGKYYSIAKFFATIGMMLIGVLRLIFVNDEIDDGWRFVYYIPGIITVVVTILAIFFLRETDVFIDNRIKLLTMTDEEKEKEKASVNKNKNGGIFKGIGYIFKHKQLLWILVCYTLLCIATIFTQHYETATSVGAALKEINLNSALYLTEAKDLQSVKDYVNIVILIFPLGSALMQLAQGFISDKYGRRIAELVMGIITVVSYVLFYLGTNVFSELWSPYIVGFLIGSAVGSFWALGDIVMLIAEESTPTYIRSSVITAITLLAGLLSKVSDLVVTFTSLTKSDLYIGITSFMITAPALILFLIISFIKVKENRVVDLNEITE